MRREKRTHFLSQSHVSKWASCSMCPVVSKASLGYQLVLWAVIWFSGGPGSSVNPLNLSSLVWFPDLPTLASLWSFGCHLWPSASNISLWSVSLLAFTFSSDSAVSGFPSFRQSQVVTSTSTVIKCLFLHQKLLKLSKCKAVSNIEKYNTFHIPPSSKILAFASFLNNILL